ncbi:hypothetical protein PR048_014800 [Dryococelus australis]|uniref:Uncharacterized protein n=1 Tax=Dryococelus australis TaxID=614101 RepID=A0ABQ9HF62_9NEOP|nr:hypothetical protein PR048_014800 [Dryococelus australis]
MLEAHQELEDLKTHSLQWHTDGSLQDSGAVLYQLDEDGNKLIVTYGITNGMVWLWCLRYANTASTLQTKYLTWLDSMQGRQGKLVQWALLLQSFYFMVEHDG